MQKVCVAYPTLPPVYFGTLDVKHKIQICFLISSQSSIFSILSKFEHIFPFFLILLFSIILLVLVLVSPTPCSAPKYLMIPFSSLNSLLHHFFLLCWYPEPCWAPPILPKGRLKWISQFYFLEISNLCKFKETSPLKNFNYHKFDSTPLPDIISLSK